MAKDIRRTCGLCGGTTRLEVDHVNETHDDNHYGNHRVLCKHCHMEKTRIGNYLFETLLEMTRNDTKLKATIRYSSAKWLSQVKDARPSDGSTDLQMSFYDKIVDPGDLYSKEEINELLITKASILEDIR